MTVGEYKDELPEEFQKPQYQWWRKALARNRLPIHDGELRCGLYRWGNRAVAIWQTGGSKPHDKKVETHIAINGVEQFTDTLMVQEGWPHISKEPVTPQVYIACRDAGWKRPGGNAIAEASNTAIGVGHNAAPADTSPEMLSEQLGELEREAQRLLDAGAAKTQAGVDEAARVADALSNLQKRVVDLHKVAKEPHLRAGRAVDAIWFPIRDAAYEIKSKIKLVVVTPFLRAEEDRRYQENVEMIRSGIEPSAIVEKGAKASGGTRTTALRTIITAEITDYNVVWAALKEHPSVRLLIQDIATASAKAGIELPGTKIVKTRSAV